MGCPSWLAVVAVRSTCCHPPTHDRAATGPADLLSHLRWPVVSPVDGAPSCWFVSMRPAVAPLDPARVVKALLSVVDAGPPEKFDQAVVVVYETDNLVIDRDRPTAGKGKAVNHYRGTHPSRAAHGDVTRRPAELRKARPERNMDTGTADGPHGV